MSGPHHPFFIRQPSQHPWLALPAVFLGQAGKRLGGEVGPAERGLVQVGYSRALAPF